jgi:hypothetical protein
MTEVKQHVAHRDETAAEVAREEHADFSRSHADRVTFDRTAFDAARRHRRAMPREDTLFDPGLQPGFEVELAVIRDDGGEAVARPLDKQVPFPALVQEVEVRADEAFAPATLVVPIDPEETLDVHPATLEILRWDDGAEAYRPLGARGLNIAGGYVWARITRPGIYAVFGLPLPHAWEKVADLTVEPKLFARYFSGWQLIIVRTFVPEGAWEPLGPANLSCCIADLALEPGTDRVYAAASDGGVWGLNSVAQYPTVAWEPLTDNQPSLEINCVAVSPADHAVVYYGDRLGRLFRSGDRGTTWVQRAAGLGDVRRLAPHSTQVDTLYLATEAGLRCTSDAGTSWRTNPGHSTLRDGEFLDVALDPGDPSAVFAAQRSTGVLKSVDSGATWSTCLAWSRAASPAGSMIKVAVGGQGSSSTRTLAAKLDQEIFISSDAGSSWTSKGQQGGSGYGDWCHVIAVDPFDDDVVLAGAQQLFRTADGGGTWNLVVDYYKPHEDQHRVVFDTTSRGVVYIANDGGVFRSTDGGVTWQTGDDDVTHGRDLTIALETAQFYTAAVSGDHAVGDTYHQGLIGANTLDRLDWSGIEGHAWEFANVFGDPVRAGVYYVFGGSLFRRTFPGGGLETIGSFTPSAIGICQSGSKAALTGDSTGGALATTDITASPAVWTAMAGKSGGDQLVSIAFAPTSPPEAYGLTSAGRLFRCADVDAAATWTERTPLPAGSGVALAVSAEDDLVVYAIDGSHAYRSSDGGGSWQSIPGTAPANLPPGAGYVSIAAGPGHVYLAASGGVFRSPDGGEHWLDYTDGLPNVEVKELLWTEGDLFAVTHGRGLWHHGHYSETWIPPHAHVPDIKWLIELWLAVHGGDPGPEQIRQRLGRAVQPFERHS